MPVRQDTVSSKDRDAIAKREATREAEWRAIQQAKQDHRAKQPRLAKAAELAAEAEAFSKQARWHADEATRHSRTAIKWATVSLVFSTIVVGLLLYDLLS